MAAQISDPTAVALERAARDVLGADASIRVVQQATPIDDDAALARAGAADGVVEVSWHDDDRSVELHCYLARDRRWLDRTVTFDRDDADSERGRMLGFAIGSMLVAEKENQSRAEASVAPQRASVPDETPDAPRNPPVPARQSRWLELGGSLTTGVNGSADALGVSVGLRWRIASSIHFATGLDASFGQIEEAQATRVFASGRLGLAFQPYEAKALGELGFGVNGELFLGWLSVTHFSEDDSAPDRQSRVIGGGRALAELSVGISQSASAFVGLGPVLVAGRTEIYTHGTLAATLPVLWLTAEIGVRTAF